MTHSAGLGWLEEPCLTVDMFNFAYRSFCQSMKVMPDKPNSMSEQTWKKSAKKHNLWACPEISESS